MRLCKKRGCTIRLCSYNENEYCFAHVHAEMDKELKKKQERQVAQAAKLSNERHRLERCTCMCGALVAARPPARNSLYTCKEVDCGI